MKQRKAGARLDRDIHSKIFGLAINKSNLKLKDIPIPAYSTDISAAWEIVEEFRRGWRNKKAAAVIDMKISDWIDYPDCECSIYSPDIAKVTVYSYSMPLSICLAALEVYKNTEATGLEPV